MGHKNIENKTFGKLIAIRRVGVGDDYRSIWLCRCECGRTVEIKLHELSSGDTKSCGCLKSESIYKRCWKGFGEISRDFWSSVQRGAKSRNITFDLDIEYVWKLFLKQNKQCALTGWEIKLSKNCKKERPTASLDRIDSSKGYIEGNVQWVHKVVNLCKHVSSNQDFIKMCQDVVKHASNL